jgi:rhomboid protease GluP
MRRDHKPIFTIVISLLTLFGSFYVAYDITGSLFGKIKIVQLEAYGAITFSHLRNLEVWRLFTSQIIHVKQYHMLYNVLSFFLLGLLIERKIGCARMLFLWFVAGAIGTLFSTLFVTPPWNLGTGSSQAILGVAAFGCILIQQKIDTSKVFKFAVGFAIIPALTLDLVFAHYPKPGHMLSFFLGLVIGYFYLQQLRAKKASLR